MKYFWRFTHSSIISWSNVSCSVSTSYWPLFANRTNYRFLIMAFHFQIVHSLMIVKDFLGKKIGSKFSSAASFPDTFCWLVSFRSKENFKLVLNRVSHKHTKIGNIGIRGFTKWKQEIQWGLNTEPLQFRSHTLLSELAWHVLGRGSLNWLLFMQHLILGLEMI